MPVILNYDFIFEICAFNSHVHITIIFRFKQSSGPIICMLSPVSNTILSSAHIAYVASIETVPATASFTTEQCQSEFEQQTYIQTSTWCYKNLVYTLTEGEGELLSQEEN